MVDTRRLEKIVGLEEPGAPRARRSLALSGHRELRAVDEAQAAALRRHAMAEQNWAALAACTPAPATEPHVAQFNLLARDADVVSRFDVLRTQLVQSFRSRALVSLGISAPRDRAGVSFVTAGLIAALARRGDVRVIGLDLNLRAPSLHRFFEVGVEGALLDLLSGRAAPGDVLRKVTETVAVGFSTPASEMEMSARFSADDLAVTLADLREEYAPDFIICDLPPILKGDAALSLSTHLDAMLLVADSRASRAAEVMESERLLEGQAEFLGVILNKYSGGEVP